MSSSSSSTWLTRLKNFLKPTLAKFERHFDVINSCLGKASNFAT